MGRAAVADTKWEAAIAMMGTRPIILAVGLVIALMTRANAQDVTTIEISVKDHRFEPAQVKAPAGKPLEFKVKNLDKEPVEFESKPLQFETAIKPAAEGLIKVKAQRPGHYSFFDDLHPSTKGTLIVE
jgi:plastocyanin